MNSEFKAKCPLHGTGLSIPCKLRKCPLNVSNKHFMNCASVYMQDKELESLSALDIAFLLEKPLPEVESLINQGISHIRSNIHSSDLVTEIGSNFNVVLEFCDYVDPVTSEPRSGHSDVEMWSVIYGLESKFQNHIDEVISELESRGKPVAETLGTSATEFAFISNLFDI